MKSKVVPLRIPEGLVDLATLWGHEQHTDKATTLRQWLYQVAEGYALKLIAEGRISVGRAAELLDVSIYDIYHLAESRGVEIGATAEQFQQSLEHAEGLKARTD
jgi:predicted HTH domain antitoxin